MSGEKVKFDEFGQAASFSDAAGDPVFLIVTADDDGLVWVHAECGGNAAWLSVKQAKAIKKQLARAIRDAEAADE